MIYIPKLEHTRGTKTLVVANSFDVRGCLCDNDLYLPYRRLPPLHSYGFRGDGRRWVDRGLRGEIFVVLQGATLPVLRPYKRVLFCGQPQHDGIRRGRMSDFYLGSVGDGDGLGWDLKLYHTN